jgi:hypothetical protein
MAPAVVRGWAERPPAWLEVLPLPASADADPALQALLDDGERAALLLARAIGADLLLMDDRAGVAVAHQQGFAVTGTLGVLDLAAQRGFIELDAAFAGLRQRISAIAPRSWTRCSHAAKSEVRSTRPPTTSHSTRSTAPKSILSKTGWA